MDARAVGIVSHRGPQQLAGELSAPAERLWSDLGNIWRVSALAPGESRLPVRRPQPSKLCATLDSSRRASRSTCRRTNWRRLRETRTIPIVFAALSDPVATGIVARLDRPNGNVTGFGIWEASLAGKWLELLSEICPHLCRSHSTRRKAGRPPGAVSEPQDGPGARS
jgi:hypothetical protein